MKKMTVGLIDLGEHLPFQLSKLAKNLNGLQASYDFQEVGKIPSSVLNAQELVRGIWYDIPHLWKLVGDSAPYRCDFVVGVTAGRITHKQEKPRAPDFDYFSRSDFKRVAIVSVNKSLLGYNSPGKTILQFVTYLLIQEVAIMTAKRSLNHFGSEPCLFNDCEDKGMLSTCIENGLICKDCRDNMTEAGIAGSVIASVGSVHAWCGKNSWSQALTTTVRHPAAGIALGTGIGWFMTLFVGRDGYLIVVGITLLPLVMITYISRKTRN